MLRAGGSSKGYRGFNRAFLLASLAFGWLTALPAAAAIVFDFNSIALIGNAASGLGATATSATIQSYMTSALQTQSKISNASVAVTGALATQTYNGENNVIGQTLGTSDGGVAHPTYKDTFIMNNSFGLTPNTGSGTYSSGAKTDYFTLVFTNYLVSSITFDYEIFPDAGCPTPTNCTSRPDLKVLVGTDTSNLTQAWQTVAPNVPNNSSAAPQALGTMTLSFLSPVSVIRFSDWPATVGIDNLTLNRVPEPGSLALFGFAALAGLLVSRRRARLSRARHA